MSTAASSNKQAAGRSVSMRLVVTVVLAALAIVFVFQNSTSGRIRFLFWDFSMPAWIWLLVVLAVGVVIGSLFPWFRPKKDSKN